ncbi:hypothetical protein LTR85_011548 [Meristemomyces frigidus]|nr:hypothetical protein LTR85_011548 [Meristemomyces frigidus]
MLSIAQHIGSSRTPPMATRTVVAPGAPKIDRRRVPTLKTGNDSPPRSILNAVKDALAGKNTVDASGRDAVNDALAGNNPVDACAGNAVNDALAGKDIIDASDGDIFTSSSPKLYGSLLGPSSLAGVVYENKSKEIDSGVKIWETTNHDPTRMASTIVNRPTFYTPRAPTKLILDGTKMDTTTPIHVKEMPQFISELFAAQQVYPARYSVFVGNLPAQFSNEELTRMVIAEFQVYGTVYAVVYRTKTFRCDKPWAILQFTVSSLPVPPLFPMAYADQLQTLPAATNAVKQTFSTNGKGHEIVDRVEVCNRLTKYGKIEHAYAPDNVELSIMCGQGWLVHEGVKVTFETYGAYKAAKAALGGAKGDCRFVY